MMLFSAAALLLPVFGPGTHQEPESAQETSGVAVDREVGVHNYLVTRFHVLRQGLALRGVRAEITSEVDFSGLSPESLTLLRKTLEVCNTASLRAAGLQADLDELDKKKANEDLGDLVQLGAALWSGGLTVFTAPSILGLLDDSSATKGGKLEAASLEVLRSDLSSLEFELATHRSMLQSKFGVPRHRLLRSQDYEQYTAALRIEDSPRRLAGVAAAHARSPWLQPAALFLAGHYFMSGDREECTRLATLALDASPPILYRDPLRVQAYLLLSESARGAAPDQAIEWCDAGLAEDAASVPLLTSKISALLSLGDHSRAYPELRQLDLLQPNKPWILYNLACCQAVVDVDVERALQTFKGALENGWEDIAHAREDPDLAIIREQMSDAWDSLLTPRFALSIDELLLSDNALILQNLSAFPLTDLKISVRLTVPARSRNRDASETRSVLLIMKVPRLAVGESYRKRGATSYDHDEIQQARVYGTSRQGEFNLTIDKRDIGRER